MECVVHISLFFATQHPILHLTSLKGVVPVSSLVPGACQGGREAAPGAKQCE